MGDDTPPAAMLDRLPRRLEDHFKLRFAQETSPPIDPIRDAWVFETAVALGDRSGLWRSNGKDGKQAAASGPVYMLPERILSMAELAALETRAGHRADRAAVRRDARAAGARGGARRRGRARPQPRGARRRDRALRPRRRRLARRGAAAARGEPPARRARQGGPAAPRRDRGRRRGVGHPARGAARLGGRRRALPLARLPERGRAREDVPQGPARRLRRGDVDDGRDAGVGLLRRQADRGRRARPRLAAHGVPGCRAAPGRHRPRRARSRVAELPRRGVPARGEGRARRRRRVPLPERGPSPRQQPRRGAHAARRLGLRRARQGRLGLEGRLRDVRAHGERSAAARRPRPAAHRAARRARPARGGGGRGARAVALHGARHERGRAIGARAPRGRARDERAPPLLPREVPARGGGGPAGHRPDRELRRGRLRQEPHRPRRRQPQHPVRGRALHGHADDRRARGRVRGEVRAGRQAGQGRPAAGQEGLRRASRSSAAASRATSSSRRP